MTLYLSRLTLRRDPSTAALRSLIDPAHPARGMDAHHKLIWTLFADHEDRKRDFLWRAEGKGRFYALSVRPPAPAPWFEPPEVKEFAPDLREGDRLSFVLRANATRTRTVESLTEPGETKKQRVDIVMDALHPLKSGRAEARMSLANDAAFDWLAKLGRNTGFTPDDRSVDPGDPDSIEPILQDYSVIALPSHRGKRDGQPQFGVIDIDWRLTVDDPEAFQAGVAQGFGRAKAFGCGLMMIRRAP